jgi:hypothetical protein
MFYISKTKRLVLKKNVFLICIHHQLTIFLQAFQRHPVYYKYVYTGCY